MIPVSNNLKNAVINEEMPKYLRIRKGRTYDYSSFNMITNPMQIGKRGLEGGTDITELVKDVSNLFSLDSIAYQYIKGNRKISISLYLNCRDAELRRKGTQTWDTTAKPTNVKLRVTYELNGTTGTSNGSEYAYTLYDNKAVQSMFPLSMTLNDNMDEITSFHLYSVAIVYGFDSATYDGLVISNTIDLTKVSVSSLSGGISSYQTPATDMWLERFLDSEIANVNNDHIIGESFNFEESVCSADTLKLGGCETTMFKFSTFDDSNDYLNKNISVALNINNKGSFFNDYITVKKVDKQSKGGTIVKNITAYDYSYNLDRNAYAWYTRYMFGLNLTRESTYRPYHFDYERQMFSVYWNLAKEFGLENMEKTINAEKTFLTSFNLATWSNDYQFNNDYFGKESRSEYTIYCDWFQISKTTFDSYGSFQAILLKYSAIYNLPEFYANDYDELYRGIGQFGSIMVEFYDSNDTLLGSFLLDHEDIVLPPEGWDRVRFIVPTAYAKSGQSKSQIAEALMVYGVNFAWYNPYEIVNATLPLPYYSYIWRKPSITDICRVDSSTSARTVLRSLCEMFGCFFRISRPDGKIQFVYPMEHGLYPSNTLFPADDLFPKKSSEMTMPTSYYISAEFAEFQVEKYGGVQVVVNTKDNTGAVCRWEYWGDDTSDNAYLIDDNIFLCAEEFVYDAQSTENIDRLLENLFSCLDNMQYTPFTAETIGTPFLESGDRFTLLTKNDGFESFIFERKLRGIQALKDHFEARGIAKTPRVKNFEWES